MKKKSWLYLFVLTVIPVGILSKTLPLLAEPNADGDDAVRYVRTGEAREGADMGSQINTAYASLPMTGGTVVLVGHEDGRCYDFTTPIVAAIPGKYLLLESGSRHLSDVTAAPVCLNFTSTTALTAITLDYIASGEGVNWAIHGIRNLTLINNGCKTIGGCGSGATGILLGGANGGVQGATFEGLHVAGFGTGLSVLSSTSGGGTLSIRNCTFLYNGTGAEMQNGAEHVSFEGCQFQGNGIGVSSSASVDISNSTLDSNIVLAVNCSAPAACDLSADHFENSNADTTHYLSGNGIFSVLGGDMRDDRTTGTTDWWVNFAGASFFIVGTAVTSGGRTAAHVILNQTGGTSFIQNNTPSILKRLYSSPLLVGADPSDAGTSGSQANGSGQPSAGSKTTAEPTWNGGTVTGSVILTDPCNINGLIYLSGRGCYTTLQAAYAALPLSGGTIILPNGTLKLSSTLFITKPVVLIGQGTFESVSLSPTCLVWTGGAGPAISVSGKAAHSSFRDFALGNEGAGTVGIDIDGNPTNLDRVTVSGIVVHNFSTAGIRMGNTASHLITDSSIERSLLTDNGVNLLVLHVANIGVSGVSAYNTGKTGVQIQVGDSTHKAFQVSFTGANDFEPNFSSNVDTVQILNGDKISFDGSYFEEDGSSNYAINCPHTATSCDNVSITNNRFIGAGGGGSDATKCAINNGISSSTWTITGNRFKRQTASRPAIFCNSINPAAVTMIGNTSDDVSMSLFSANPQGSANYLGSTVGGAISGGRVQTTSVHPFIIDGGGGIKPGSATFSSLGTSDNGTVIYCEDCKIANPCAGGGTGALAKRLNKIWVCN